MNRRTFFKILSLGFFQSLIPLEAFAALKYHDTDSSHFVYDEHIKDYLDKIKNFDELHENDLFLDKRNLSLLYSSLSRLIRVEKTVGHGTFALISIDQAIHTARLYPSIGAFTRDELDFLEMIFYKDGTVYGFLGEKPLPRFTDTLKNNIIKIPETGNYLYKGASLETYKKIKKVIGDEMFLTSGLRSVTKQFMLFLKKAAQSRGNLSQASRSLAPPGYSFHGVGDFDVGQVGYGIDNFTWRFTETDVYKKLIESGFSNLRYTQQNTLGVRFEPWHIKVS